MWVLPHGMRNEARHLMLVFNQQDSHDGHQKDAEYRPGVSYPMAVLDSTALSSKSSEAVLAGSAVLPPGIH